MYGCVIMARDIESEKVIKFVVNETYSSRAARTTVRTGRTSESPHAGRGEGRYTADTADPMTDVGACMTENPDCMNNGLLFLVVRYPLPASCGFSLWTGGRMLYGTMYQCRAFLGRRFNGFCYSCAGCNARASALVRPTKHHWRLCFSCWRRRWEWGVG